MNEFLEFPTDFHGFGNFSSKFCSSIFCSTISWAAKIAAGKMTALFDVRDRTGCCFRIRMESLLTMLFVIQPEWSLEHEDK